MKLRIEITKPAPNATVGQRFWVSGMHETGYYTLPTDGSPMPLFFYFEEAKIVIGYPGEIDEE